MKADLKEDERIDLLMQYDIEIIQSKSVFSFSLDAILLSEFARIPTGSKSTIVDLCAGNGAITLMLSRQTESKVYGLELQERLVDMAKRSIRLNQLEDQVEMIQADVKESQDYFKRDSVDVITCNPPYFEVSDESRKNPNQHLALARHEIETNFEEIVRISSQILRNKGKIHFVHRPERFLELIDTMRTYRLYPKRIQFIYPKKSKEANMVLIEGIKNGSESGLKMLHPIVVHDENGNYMPEVRRIIYGKEDE